MQQRKKQDALLRPRAAQRRRPQLRSESSWRRRGCAEKQRRKLRAVRKRKQRGWPRLHGGRQSGVIFELHTYDIDLDAKFGKNMGAAGNGVQSPVAEAPMAWSAKRRTDGS